MDSHDEQSLLVLFKEALQQYRCYLRKSHFDGKSINEFPVKSPVLNLEDIEWKNLVMHWSRSQDEVLSMKSHDNLNFYFSACALRIFFAGNLLEEEFRFEKNDRISQICCLPLCSCQYLLSCITVLAYIPGSLCDSSMHDSLLINCSLQII